MIRFNCLETLPIVFIRYSSVYELLLECTYG